MDVAGAKTLKAKIDERQQRHWQQARAVREGRQDLADPDSEHLAATPSANTSWVRAGAT
jgi:hypothetical protein